tara:strand:- start:967 stop:1644 length:678 start_codon:yes stop_codon:yes gene_type:complete
MVKYFTIYGERCSGTNFVENAIKKNFKLELTWEYDFKHFFGNYKFKEKNRYNQVLFIGIIRSPFEWLPSLYREKHHLPYSITKDWDSYINHRFYSIDINTKKELLEDRNIYNKQKRYKDIIELRYIKNKFLIENMKNKVNNYILLRYEDFSDRYQLTMNFLKKKYNLVKLHKEIRFINNYKGYGNNISTNDNTYKKKKYFIPNNILLKIKKKLNKEQEKSLGYVV